MATTIDLADLAAAVQAQTTTIANFTDQQILLYTTTDPTVVVTDANGNPVTVPSWYATVGANQAAVGAMQTAVTNLQAQVAAIDSGDTTINNNIVALQTVQAGHTTSIDALTTQLGVVSSNQTADEAAIATLQSQIATIGSGGSDNGSAITALQTQVSANTTSIGALTTQQTANTNNITTLTTTTTGQTNDIAALQTSVANNAAAIAANGSTLSSQAIQITAIANQQTTNTNNIATNTANIATNAAGISTTQAAVAQNGANISTLQGNVSTLQTTVASNSTALGNVQSDLTNVQTATAGFSAGISGNAANITTLTDTVATLPTPGAYNPPYVSNRFFEQAWLDETGRLLGGISRKTGKLWLQSGGWLSERIDALEAATNPETWTYADQQFAPLVAGTADRYLIQFGTMLDAAAITGQGGYTPQTILGGFRVDDGDLEVLNGIRVGKSLTLLDENAPPVLWTWGSGETAFIGDSTMNGIAFGTGPATINVSTMTSSQLAARVGASPVLLSVTGRKILASGATTISSSQTLDVAGAMTALNPITADLTGGVIDGSLNGVRGLLTRGASDTDLTFVPSTTLTADFYIPDNCPFIPTDGDQFLSNCVVIGIGRNNLDDLPTVKRDIQNIVNAIPTRVKQFVVVTPFPYAAEDSSSANGIAIAALEQWVSFTYPQNHVLSRQMLQNVYAAGGAADAGTYFTNGTIPASYYEADNQTLTSAARGYIQFTLANLISLKGW